MASITGKDGAVTIAGGSLNARLISWSLSSEARTVEDTGAGDTLVGRLALFTDWTVEVETAPINQATWDQLAGSVGSNVDFTLKRKSGDANPYALGTGMMMRHSMEAPHDDRITCRITIQCSGTALTYDTTPAS